MKWILAIWIVSIILLLLGIMTMTEDYDDDQRDGR